VFFSISILKAQNIIPLKFIPAYGSNMLSLQDSSFQSNDKDSIVINLCRFYISGIELLDGETSIWKEPNSFHLIDAAIKTSQELKLSIPTGINYNTIQFNLGIDSITNVSGAEGGDLDPMRGMYWTWQSGFINLKLEGTSKLCNTRHHAFEFHIGGYHSPNNALQTIRLPIKSTNKIEIIADIKNLLQQIDLTKTNQLMTPGKDAVSFAQKAFGMFYCK